LKLTKHVITKTINCFTTRKAGDTHPSIICSNNIIEKLAPLNLVLKSNDEMQTRHGSVHIDHGYGKYITDSKGKLKYVDNEKIIRDHVITITIYDGNESPNKWHKCMLKKPDKIPTKSQIENLLK